MISRILSAAIALLYLGLAYWIADAELMIKLLAYLIAPLACIWFSEELGSLTGYSQVGLPPVNHRTPGCMVAAGGWLLLLLPAGVYFVYRLYGVA